jgi:methionyl-tRNA synthetase
MSAQKPPYTVTTAIDYVNAAPHLGHAYEKIASDVLARYARLQGRPVFFLTGTDEHGTKVEKTAKSKGLEPKAYTDEVSGEFKKAWEHLNLSYDRFIRTTDTDHYEVVAHLWQTMAAKDDIYKAGYQGLYCAGCEKFVTAKDLDEEGLCPNHQTKPDLIEEENYFFRLTKYRDAIREAIESGKLQILPEFRKNEVLAFLEELEDISVSRSVNSVSWGIPVPGDPDQRIYVWIDALSNYITGLGYRHDETLFNRFWNNDAEGRQVVHIIGKDILRFHAIYWPAMLMSAELPLPTTIFAHGFITINDSKISKSLGNTVSPFSLSETFALPNADPIRYYLMTTTTFGQDGNFSEEDFKLRINADLANNLGNLLNRTLSMNAKYFEGKVPPREKLAALPDDWRLLEETAATLPKIEQAFEQYAFNTAAELILSRVDAANKLINIAEPWNLFKNGELDTLAGLMHELLETLRQVGLMLWPLTPSLAEGIWQQLGFEVSPAEIRWDFVLGAPIPDGQQTNPTGPLLPRLDSEIVGAAKKK